MDSVGQDCSCWVLVSEDIAYNALVYGNSAYRALVGEKCACMAPVNIGLV